MARMLKKDQRPHFEKVTGDESLALLRLQEYLITPLITPGSVFFARSDGACTMGTYFYDPHGECNLLQEQTAGPYSPKGYWPKSLTEAEGVYETTHKKYLHCLMPYCHWSHSRESPDLSSKSTTTRCTGSELRECCRKFVCLPLLLSEFEFDVLHWKGLKYQAADTFCEARPTWIIQIISIMYYCYLR